MQPIKIYTQPQIEVTIGNDDTVVQVNQSGTPIELTVGGTFVAWGDIVGSISDQSDLQTALDSKVDENSPIVGATKTKITYDSKGLVTAGADAGISDITGLQTALDSKVNKSGDTMTGDLNFTGSGINQADYVEFNTSYNNGIVEGRVQWNDDDGTLELGLPGGNILADLVPNHERVVNKTGSQLLRGKVVYINGSQGNRPTVTYATNATEAGSSKTFGILEQNINDNGSGYLITGGLLRNINTVGYTAGQTLYLGTNGDITNVKPSAPNHMVTVGKAIDIGATGSIYVSIINGFELQELHNVAIDDNTLADGQVLKYNASTDLWENGTGGGGGGVTSIATSSPITGGTITSTGTIGISQATTSSDGYLSSTDWNTFNGKQNLLTNPITGTGSSGQVAYFNGSTSITSESNLFWDAANNRLGIGTTTPSQSIESNGDILINGVLIGSKSVLQNTIVGRDSLAYNTTGISNSSFSFRSLQLNTTGYSNSAFGTSSLRFNISGFSNSAFGVTSLYSNTTGSSNTGIGQLSLYSNTTGSNNTAVGYESGAYAASGTIANETSSNSIYLGYKTRSSANGNTNEIVIGYDALGLGSNTTVIGNSSTTQSKLFGSLEVGTVNNATTDTDRFLVSDSGVIKYRTGSELLSDIGGQSALTNPITGTGTTNELTYFTGSTTVSSLSTATYPSLTELSYVKGVTSSIQTQLNGKQATLTNPITGTGTSGQVAYFNGTTSLTSETNLFWDATNDRLGIGTSSPSHTLSVAGDINLFNNATYLRVKDTSGGVPRVLGLNSGNTFYIGPIDSYAGGAIIYGASSNVTDQRFNTAGTEKLRIFNGGNVLIQNGGTFTDAGFRLDVNGTTRIQNTLTVSSGGALVTGLSSFTGTTASDGGQLGAELLSSSNWTSTGWTGSFATGWTHSTGNTTALTNTLAAVNGTYYQIAYTVTGRTAGTFTIAFGGVTTSGLTATGATGPRATSTGTLSITPTTDFDGTIVISIKVISASSASISLRNSAGTVTNEIRNATSNTNTFIGLNAGSRVTTGTDNTFGGSNSGQNTTSGTFNTSYGSLALNLQTIGRNNNAYGAGSLYSNISGLNNNAFGLFALYSNVSNNNTAFGHQAGRYAGSGTTANQNSNSSLYLGYQTRSSASGNTNEVVIGYDVVGLGSNTTILGNSSTVTTGIYGNLLLGSTTDTGEKLQVTGTTKITQQLKLTGYTTSSSYSGTPTGYLAFDSSGNVLTVAVPGALTDGDKGDITVSSSGTTWTVDNTAVTYAKIQNVTDNKLLGRSAGTSGSVQEITIGSGLSLSGGTLTSTGGSSYTISTKTANFTETATSGEIILLGDTTVGTFTITLPTAVSNTAKITIKKIAGSNNLTIDGNGSQTIDGGLTADLVTIYESITLVSDNSNWHII